MTMWALGVVVAKVSLLAFIVISVAVIVIVRRRRMRAAREEFLRTDPEDLAFKYLGNAQPGFEASARGAMPHTPLPGWAYLDDDDGGRGR